MKSLWIFFLTGLLACASALADTPDDAFRELWYAPLGLAAAPAQAHWVDTWGLAAPGCPAAAPLAMENDVPTKALALQPWAVEHLISGDIVYLQDPIAERVSIRFIDAAGCAHVQSAGRLLPFSQRAVLSPFPNFSLPALQPGSAVEMIIQDHKATRPWLKIAHQDQFQTINSYLWMLLAGNCSVLLLILMVVGTVNIWERNQTVLAYCIYNFALLIWTFENYGFGQAWLAYWPGPEHFRVTQAFSVAFVAAAVGATMLSFLKIEGRRKGWMGLAMGLGSLAFLSSGWNSYGYRIGSLELLLMASYIAYLLLKYDYKSNPSMRYFSLGFFITMISGGVQAYSILSGGTGVNPVAEYAFSIGSIIESLFWFAAIGVENRDVRREYQRNLIHDARHDFLTGLPNRIFFNQELKNCLDNPRADTRRHAAVLFLDLDRFKLVNDSLGHSSGDLLLKKFASILLQLSPENGVVARFGGDEFLVLLQTAHLQDVQDYSAKLFERLKHPINLGEREIQIDTCVGAALIESHYQTAEDVLRDADTALYHAKRIGGGRLSIFNAEMLTVAKQRFEIESDLTRYTEYTDFEVYYQPIMQMSPLEMAGFEALIRWNHPVKGLISPIHFIDVAEDIGVIHALGFHVVKQTIAQINDWIQQGLWRPGWYVSVNISGLQFQSAVFINEIVDAVYAGGLSPSEIRFEITESSMIKNIKSATELLPELARRGFRFCLDDFGTGYSSLSNIKDFPFTVLKIDKSFVDEILVDERKKALLSSVVDMAKNMDMIVVAEGIEEAGQYEALASLHCGYGQGYYFAKPLPSAAATRWLMDHMQTVSL